MEARKVSHKPHRITDLAAAIVRYKRAYYVGKPQVPDAQFDKLEDELRRLAPTHPALSMVGGELSVDLPKVKHETPMLSLQKTYDEADLLRWADEEWVVGTLKIDGVSMSLIYEDGALSLAKTRGNGLVGEEVTGKVRWVSDVPAALDVAGRLEIRGELYCSESSFIRLTDEMVSLSLDPPTSPRNIVAGLLGRKTHGDLARHFNFFAFSVASLDGDLKLKTEMEQSEWLTQHGFLLPSPTRVKGPEAIKAYLAKVQSSIDEGEVPADGAVFTYDSLVKQHALGNTSHHPRYKMSFKWQGQTATSTIREVVWATSRLGIVTPVAVIAPVTLSGASITNVTLHNAGHVKAFDLKSGDEIEIVRSGEVIPKFLQVVTKGPGEAVLPTHCPACSAELTFDEIRLKCPNTEKCPAQLMGGILNWIRSAEIDDLSEKRLSSLIEAGLIRGMADLYKLKLEDFYQIPQTKEKMAAKLLANITKTKHLPLARFLNGLGIEGAGLTTWEKLLAEAPTLKAVMALNTETIERVEGFAEKSAAQIVLGLEAKAPVIESLLAAGVQPEEAQPTPEGGPLAGKQIVITGALSRPRATLEKAIKAAGGRVASSVSANTDAVVTEDPTSTSSKMEKARKLGVAVWSEADLLKILGEAVQL